MQPAIGKKRMRDTWSSVDSCKVRILHVFFHADEGISVVVHGDDFTFLGDDAALDWCTMAMQEEYDVKVRGRLGPDKHDQKSITMLNRCLQWRADGLYYEPDPRHAEIIIEEMGVQKCSPVVTPGTKMSLLPEEDDPLLKPEHATKFRRVVARANFLAQDRMDIQYATKEAARGIANPRQSHYEKLLRLAKYLLGRKRYVIKYAYPKPMSTKAYRTVTSLNLPRTILALTLVQGQISSSLSSSFP